MILVDTSIWIRHLRRVDAHLVRLLDDGAVLTHPFVIGELACGSQPRRAEVLGLLRKLPAAPAVTNDEALHFIDRHRLMGRGVGYVDVNLLASTILAGDAQLWTSDAPLLSAAARLSILYEAS